MTLPSIIEQALKSESVESIASALGEIGLDRLIDEGVGRDVPGVGSAIGMIKSFQSARERIEVEKLNDFLLGVGNTGYRERQDQIDRINGDPKYRQTVGRRIAEVLIRIDSDAKPEMVGRLFGAVLRRELDYDDFLELCFCIEQQYTGDLLAIKKRHNSGIDMEGLSDRLFTSGLLIAHNRKPDDAPEDDDWTSTPHYEPTELGNLFIRHAFRPA